MHQKQDQKLISNIFQIKRKIPLYGEQFPVIYAECNFGNNIQIKEITIISLTFMNKFIKMLPKHKNKSADHYIIVKEISEGGFAKIYLAIQHHTKKRVAIKCMDKSRNSSFSHEIFEKQVSIQSSLNHPRIVNVLEKMEDDEHFYIVQQYCSGGDLLTKLQKQGPLSVKQANLILSQIIQALSYMDSKKIYHRDLKPENILFDRDGNVKLCDFGLACTNPDNLHLIDYCGSTSYMSPEIAGHRAYLPLESDIWSLGVLYYAMISGDMLFPGDETITPKEEILSYNYKMPWNVPSAARLTFRLMINTAGNRGSLQSIWKSVSQSLHEELKTMNDQQQDQISLNKNLKKKIQKLTGNSEEFIQKSIKQKLLNPQYSLYQLLKDDEKYIQTQPSLKKSNKKIFETSVTLEIKRKIPSLSRRQTPSKQSRRQFRISSRDDGKKYKRFVVTPAPKANDYSQIRIENFRITKENIFKNIQNSKEIPGRKKSAKTVTKVHRDQLKLKKLQKNLKLIAVY